MVCVFVMVISYIILPLEGEKGLFLWVNSKDFYIERDWNRVVNNEVIFIFSDIL